MPRSTRCGAGASRRRCRRTRSSPTWTTPRADLAERLDGAHYRDDILRLLFICCHPDLPATQQIALALRIVSGLSVKQIARAFLVSESAMEQRITRAKRRVAEADVPFETPGAVERAERLAAVAAMIYLIFNEGYSASGGGRHCARRSARRRSGSPGCCCGCSRREPEIMGLLALLLLQHARAPARFDADGAIVLLEDQDRGLWNRTHDRRGARADRQGDAPPPPRSLPGAGRDRGAACAGRPARKTPIGRRSICSMPRSRRLQPSPVVTLNRAVAVAKVRGPAAALAMIEPLAPQLSGYFHFFGVKGGLLMQLGRAEEARVAFDRAIALANTAAEAAHIRLHLDRLIKDGAPPATPRYPGNRKKIFAAMSNRRPFVRPRDMQDPDNNTTQERTMLKTIVIIAIVVVVLLAAVLVYAATKPDTFRVERSIGIKAPPEKIFALVDDLHSHRAWSPWEQRIRR